MASEQGTSVIDFGPHPGSNSAAVSVETSALITYVAACEAFVMCTGTYDGHTENDHRYFALLASLTCGDVTEAIGFTIYATSEHKLTGKFTLNWVWSND